MGGDGQADRDARAGARARLRLGGPLAQRVRRDGEGAWPAARAGCCSSTFRAIGRLINQYAADHGQAIAGGIPILALDMYEHAYHIDFGANATGLRRHVHAQHRLGVDPERATRMRQGRAAAAARAEGVRRPAGRRRSRKSRRCWTAGKPVQIIDARPRPYISRQQDIMEGAVWRDPERIHDWIGRAVEIRPGRRVLRLRLPRRLQDGDRAARGGLRREVHEGRPLGLEGDRRADQAVHVTVPAARRPAMCDNTGP